MTFDAYHKWLAIPPAEQPPNHYRLLGVALFENDADVIESAADRQTAHVRQFQTGEHGQLCAGILNQIAAAKLLLLDRKRRGVYDAVLKNARDTQGGEEDPAAQTPPGPPFGRGGGSESLPRALELTKKPGTILGEFELLEYIGGGQSSPLYKARQQSTGRIFSIKVLPKELGKTREMVLRFQRESELAKRLDHPNLIVAYDTKEHEGTHYLVLEHVTGTDLASLVRKHGPLSPEQAIDYVVQAAEGLAYLHEHAVIHRNVKPHNLIVNVQGRLKIASLLLARLEENAQQLVTDAENLTRTGQMIGSVDYMSVEQAVDAKRVDARADIYSLGCTLHHLLTGRPPYGGKSMTEKLLAHKSHPIPTLLAARSDVPAWLDQVFRRMVAKERDERYASMKDVIRALEGQGALPGHFSWLLVVAAVVVLGLIVWAVVAML
ncbi:MAG: serine/threonine protein kinase [Planctomycetia bacterium]|nr:serine/threonine protein kinase [Planctomycetia bacterium]